MKFKPYTAALIAIQMNMVLLTIQGTLLENVYVVKKKILVIDLPGEATVENLIWNNILTLPRLSSAPASGLGGLRASRDWPATEKE